MAPSTWSDLSPGRRSALGVLAFAEVALAVAAWTDLARRPAEQVAGSKGKWALVIAINVVGPILYFTKGRR